MNEQTIRYLQEEYPFGIPARLVKTRPTEGDSAAASVVFSGPSGSRLAVVFIEDTSGVESARELVAKAITSGLQRSISEVLLIQCSPDVRGISLADCGSRVVLLAGIDPSAVRDAGSATLISTDSIASVLTDRESKRRFWQALKQAWEESQR